MALITLQQAVDHLRLPQELGSPALSPTSLVRDLQTKMAQAEALILDYIKVSLTSPPDWDVDTGTVPVVVQLAVMVQLGELWRFRGDDAAAVDQSPRFGGPGDINQQAKDYLWRYRDPAIA